MLEAVKDKIIVELLKRSQTAGGIIAPSAAIIDPQGYGRVISTGDEVDKIKVGEVLIFHTNGGMEIVVKDKIYRVLKYDEVYGKLQDKELIEQLEQLELTTMQVPQVPQLQGAGGNIIGAQ
jgi:co-chaperonin GroES (HSP10)